MELLVTSLPLISVLILYILNRGFNYKAKLLNKFGIKKYKMALLVIVVIIGFIEIWKYEVNVFKDPVGLSVFLSYVYLINV